MLSLPTIITLSPFSIVSSEAACQVVPLKSIFPLLPGEISVSALAILPRNSSSSSSDGCFLFNKIFDNPFLNKRMLATELTRKMISWALIDISRKRHKIATIQAPTAKKKSMRPGITNSNKKRTNPIIIQITAAVRKFSIEIGLAINFQR